jgi:hypothetical protein
MDKNGTKTSTGGIGYLFGNSGLGPYTPIGCITANTPGPTLPPVNVPTGATRYIGTVNYLFDVCAAGTFDFDFECTDQPGGCDNDPEATNTTRYREDNPIAPGQGPLLSMVMSGTTLTVNNGACCDGTTCFCDGVGQACCEAMAGTLGRPTICGAGDTWTIGETCFLADGVTPNPGACACTDDSQCADNFCAPRHCDVASGMCVGDPAPVCPGTTQCTNGVCDPAANGGAGGCVVNNKPDGLACSIGGEGNPQCDNPDTCVNGICVENAEPAGTPCDKDPNPGDPDCDNPAGGKESALSDMGVPRKRARTFTIPKSSERQSRKADAGQSQCPY